MLVGSPRMPTRAPRRSRRFVKRPCVNSRNKKWNEFASNQTEVAVPHSVVVMLVGSLATSGTRHRLQTMLPARLEATISADSRRRGIPTNPCRSDPPACSALAAAAAARTWALVAIWFAAAMTAQPAAGLERPPQRRKTRRLHPLLMRSGEDCSLLVPMDPRPFIALFWKLIYFFLHPAPWPAWKTVTTWLHLLHPTQPLPN